MKIQKMNGLMTLMLLLIATCVVIMPVQAKELKMTDNNLNALANPAYGFQWEIYKTIPLHEYLLKSSTVNLDVVKIQPIDIKRISPGVGYIGATKVNEVPSRPSSQAGLDGQCVAFVKAVTRTPNIGTGSWNKGRPVTSVQGGKKVVDSSIPVGTAIATFSGTTYSGHTAIYGNPSATGLNVWDQNYRYDKAVARHCIPYAGTTTGVTNINNYYVVNVL